MARFTLLDDVYYDAILAVRDAFEQRGLPFCLVGGGAAQLWIASLASGGGERRISTEAALPALLRKTRDADFATRSDAAESLTMLNELAAASTSGAHVIGPREMRLGPVQVSLTLEPADLSGMAVLYDSFLESRETVQVRRGTAPDGISVIGLPALIATKLTRRGDKAKDVVDVGNLVAIARRAKRRVDVEAIRGYLSGHGEAERLLSELVPDEER